MSATRLDRPLQPIALRSQDQHHSGQHPFENLRLCAHDYRIEATNKVEKLEGIFESVREIYEQMSRLDSEIRAGKVTEQAPETFLNAIQLVLITMPQLYQELHQLLTEVRGVEQIPELHSLAHTLRNYTGSKPKQQLSSIVEIEALLGMPHKLTARFSTLAESLLTLESRIMECKDFEARGVFSRSLLILQETFDNALGQPHWVLGPGKMKSIVQQFKRCATDLIAAEHENTILQSLYKAAQDIHSLALMSRDFHNSLDRFAARTIPLVTQLENIFPPETRAVLADFGTRIKPQLIEATVKSALARLVDPLETDAQPVSPERWLPSALQEASAGLGLNNKGELIAVTRRGDPQALVAAVATLIDNNDPSLYREDHINNRLAPVIRAALPEAHTLAASWAADRALKDELQAAQESARVQTAKEELEFIELFFEDTFGTSLPAKETTKDSIRSAFVTLYTDPTLIEARQIALKEIASMLSMPDEYLTNHYECYLLTDRELDRWSKQAQRLRTQMLKSSDPADHLTLHDPSNFLPAALPELLRRYVPNHSDMD